MWKKINITKLICSTELSANVHSILGLKKNFRSTPKAIQREWLLCHKGSGYFNLKQTNQCRAVRFIPAPAPAPAPTSIPIAALGSYALAFTKRSFSTTKATSSWRSQMELEDKRRKVIPKLIYLHNPWKFIVTKYNLWKLRLLWDRDFVEDEFIRGSKQAAVVLTDIIRTQNTSKVSQFTTPLGFQQITRDMLLSRNDSRLKLIKFDTEHFRRAIPIQVATRTNFGQKFCFIDMLFVGLRNTQDFKTPEEVFEVKEVLRQLDADMKTPMEVMNVPHRIVFVEILIRFRRNYSDYSNISSNPGPEIDNRDWAVSFYKILTFDVLNYDPRK